MSRHTGFSAFMAHSVIREHWGRSAGTQMDVCQQAQVRLANLPHLLPPSSVFSDHPHPTLSPDPKAIPSAVIPQLVPAACGVAEVTHSEGWNEEESERAAWREERERDSDGRLRVTVLCPSADS